MENEKRLIDANALEFEPDENCIANGVLIWGGRHGGKTMTTVLSALKVMIDNAPTVDAVEVVRCEKCQYWNPRYETMGMCMKHNSMTFTKHDFYCAWGKDKNDGIRKES